MITWSAMVFKVLEAAERLEREMACRSRSRLENAVPMDDEADRRHGEEDQPGAHRARGHAPGGVAGEITAASTSGLEWLDAPVRRVVPTTCPLPYAPTLEISWLTQVDDVVAACGGWQDIKYDDSDSRLFAIAAGYPLFHGTPVLLPVVVLKRIADSR